MVRVGVIDVADRNYVLLQVCFCACEKEKETEEERGESESYCKSLGYTKSAKRYDEVKICVSRDK